MLKLISGGKGGKKKHNEKRELRRKKKQFTSALRRFKATCSPGRSVCHLIPKLSFSPSVF